MLNSIDWPTGSAQTCFVSFPWVLMYNPEKSLLQFFIFTLIVDVCWTIQCLLILLDSGIIFLWETPVYYKDQNIHKSFPGITLINMKNSWKELWYHLSFYQTFPIWSDGQRPLCWPVPIRFFSQLLLNQSPHWPKKLQVVSST